MPVHFLPAQLSSSTVQADTSRESRGEESGLPSLESRAWRKLRELQSLLSTNHYLSHDTSPSTSSLDTTAAIHAPSPSFDIENGVVCYECGTQVDAFSFKRHEASECPFRVVECRHPSCRQTFLHIESAWHYAEDCKARKHREKLVQNMQKRGSEPCSMCERPAGRTAGERKKHASECPARVVPCPNAKYGCREIVIAILEQHHIENECLVAKTREALAEKHRAAERAQEACDRCGQWLLQKEMKQHQAERCPKRDASCPHCDKHGIQLDCMEAHFLSECPVLLRRQELLETRSRRQRPEIQCPFQCKSVLSEAELYSHCRKECVNRFVSCSCGVSVREKDLALHKKQDITYTIHKVEKCVLAVKRDELAAVSLARDRKPGLISCPKCSMRVKKVALNSHFEEECLERPLLCKYTYIDCSLQGRKIPAREMPSHLDHDCPGARMLREQAEKGMKKQLERMPCPNGCGFSSKRIEMPSHLELFCERRLVLCRDGCGQLVAFSDLSDHRAYACRSGLTRDALAQNAKLRQEKKENLV